MMVNSKKGQVTLFIVLAIIVVVGIVGFFIYQDYFKPTNVPDAAQPVYSYYLSCIESITLEGVSILESQGGYIETPEFEAGSPYMPSSSQLDLLGVAIPHWFYVSGNNIVREQVPTIRSMETDLQLYIQEDLQNCDFGDFESRGYLVDVDAGSVTVEIENSQINVEVKNELRFSLDEDFYRFGQHRLTVRSKLGRLYSLAKEIYDYQKEEKFLESYALDTLALNAPTRGFEVGCTPLFFNFPQIRQNISLAMADNFAFVKLKGSYSSSADSYFVKDIGINVNEPVNFLYSSSWPTKIEIYGKDFAEPVGLQPGMNMLGFCFVEYNLIYDVILPVLVQIGDEREMFQFPLVVFVERNQIKKDTPIGEYFGQEEVVCKNRNQEMEISVKDFDDKGVASALSFSCLGERCFLGETTNGHLKTNVPMCVNGIVEARSEGYAPGSFIVSSNQVQKAEILARKIYSINVDLGAIAGNALVRFSSDDMSSSIMYPENRKVDLAEGVYDVTVQVFTNSTITLPARTEEECFEMPSSGLGALTGSTETKCFSNVIPAQSLDQVLIGGGNSLEFFDDNSLRNSKKILINVPLFSVPTKLEDINENYIKFEDSPLGVSLE